MAPRVELISGRDAPVTTAHLFDNGDPGPLIAAWAQVPELLDVTLPFVGMILGPSAIGLRPKELVILRTSAVLQCRYCIDAHTEVALDVGLDATEVAALRTEQPIGTAFDDAAELALLDWTDAVALGPGTVSDDLADELRRHWRDHEIVELTMLIAATLMLNRFATSLQLPTGDATLRRLREAGFPSSSDPEPLSA